MSVILTVRPSALYDPTTGRRKTVRNQKDIAVYRYDVEYRAENARHTLATEIKNKEFLLQVLDNIGARTIVAQRAETGIFAILGEREVQFVPGKDGNQTAKFYGPFTEGEAYQFINELSQEYGAVVQNHVYESLRAKAEEKGIVLVNETMQEDQTIVLTYNL